MIEKRSISDLSFVSHTLLQFVGQSGQSNDRRTTQLVCKIRGRHQPVAERQRTHHSMLGRRREHKKERIERRREEAHARRKKKKEETEAHTPLP